ncbi:hypothetical protein HLB23_07005 [Nocardia uniformis]|uniref:Uncharacterized protein n=1 Tax=Nocardia uniformis TaxID=53432 RepID=A0A849BX65_9NOCA|nr:hypothetical protein [Nocardia uniformis]NNH69616.1 hypothetical protein [Nocardia uniformis]
MIRLAPHIAVAAAGDPGSGTFAVCDGEGAALWYGPYSDFEHAHPRGPRMAASMAAATRAVWLAGRACAETGLRQADVHLTVPDREVDAAVLFSMATMAGLRLRLLAESENPAHDWCRVPGQRDWRPGTLAALVEYRAVHDRAVVEISS